MATKGRKYVLRSHFSGLPKREDLEIVEETLQPLKDGGTATMNCLFITQSGYTLQEAFAVHSLCAIRRPCAVLQTEYNKIYVHTHFTCTIKVCSFRLDSIPKVNLNLSPTSLFLPLSLHTEFLCEAQWLSVDPYMR